MDRKDGLGQINSNDDNTHDIRSEMLMKSRSSIMALSMPVAAASPLHGMGRSLSFVGRHQLGRVFTLG